MAACHANGALHLFPGTVYNYGSPMPAIVTEDTPFRPTTEKGRIRTAMEALFRREADAGRVRTIISEPAISSAAPVAGHGSTWSSPPRSARASTPRPARSIWCTNGPTCRTSP